MAVILMKTKMVLKDSSVITLKEIPRMLNYFHEIKNFNF